jgi:hypothetical protein
VNFQNAVNSFQAGMHSSFDDIFADALARSDKSNEHQEQEQE